MITNKKDPMDYFIVDNEYFNFIKTLENDDFICEEVSKERYDFYLHSMMRPQ